MARTPLDPATTITTGGLAAAAAIHAAWGRGSSWPRATDDELADLVVGKRPMPPPAASTAVAVLLTGAAGSVAIAGHTNGDGLIATNARRLATVVAGALGLRGVGGLAMAAVGGATSGLETTEEFRRMDLRFYSPLCVGLGLGAARAARRGRP